MSGNDVIKQFADEATIHGIPRIIKSQNKRKKFIWSIVVTVSLFVFGFYTYDITAKYFRYEKKVDLDISRKAVPFPDITICNLLCVSYIHLMNLTDRLMPIWGESAEKLNISDVKLFPEPYKEFMEYTIYSKEFHQEMNRKDLASFIGKEHAMNLALDYSRTVMACTYLNKKCEIHVQDIFDSYFFKCFTLKIFSEGKPLLSHQGGNKNGVKLTLFTGPRPVITDFPPVGPGLTNFIKTYGGVIDLNEPETRSSGFRIVLHERNKNPFPQHKGITIQTQTSARIGITVNKIERAKRPHGRCSKETEEKDYSEDLCLASCLQEYKKKNCNCLDISLPLPDKEEGNSLQFCDNLSIVNRVICPLEDDSSRSTENKCIKNKIEFFNNQTSCGEKVLVAHSMQSDVNCYCPPACNELIYSTKEDKIQLDTEVGQSLEEIYASLDSLPTLKKMVKSRLKPTMSDPTFQAVKPILIKHMAFVNLYMSDTKMMTVIESAGYTEGELIGDLGGMLGLCIGLSVISVVELLELLMQLCRKKCKKRQCCEDSNQKKEKGNVQIVKSVSEG